MEYVEGKPRDQISMMSLEQWVAPESFARVIDAFVNAIDLESFSFVNSTLNPTGRPPFHPKVLLKLYLYGYHSGIRSSRKLMTACTTNVEVMWLLEERRPHYKTIANFRKDNAKQLRAVFRSFVGLLKSWKLIDGKTVAIDSFKIRAQNSLKNNFNQKKIDRHLEYIDGKIEEYFEALEQSDTPEERKEIKDKIESQKAKREAYKTIEARLAASDEDQLSVTDPDARAVILHRNIVNVGYNVQAASDSKHKMLIAIDTGDVNDTHALAPMVQQVQDNLGKTSMDVLADKGYHTGQQLEYCESLGVKTYVSPKASAANKRTGVYSVEDFHYSPKYDDYRCPAGKYLTTTGTVHYRKGKGKKASSVGFKQYKTKACKTCKLRGQCTSSRNGRLISRQEDQASITRNNRRVNRKPDYYRQRQQIIEHQFGTLKRQRGFTYTLMRGKEKVLGEVSLSFMAYNLSRAVSVLKIEGFLAYLKRYTCQKMNILLLRYSVGAYNRTNIFAIVMHRGGL